MNRAPQHHPDDLQLLRYADGELGAREARSVRQHLETCWQCRTELEEIERTIGECVRYRKHVLHANLPSPPAPWIDIHSSFARMDAAPGRASFLRGLFRSGWGISRWAVPAAAAALACVLLYQWRETPAVQAAQLLQKAVAASEKTTAKPRRIQIRTASRKLTRVVGMRSASTAEEDPLAALFRSARYDWDDPLSAKAFEAWRAQLPTKRDEIATATGRYTIHTSTDASELASASLTLRSHDLHPVEGRLEFRNREVVELFALPDEQPPSPSAAADGALPSPPAGIARSAAPVVGPPREPGAPEELQVLAALHELGADLGDPVEVSRTPDAIVVSGVGVAPERQRQIRGALQGMSNVEVRFAEPAASPHDAPPDASASPQAANPQSGSTGADLHSQVERQLGGRTQLEAFSSQLLDAGEAAMSRAYALRRLAQRFPAGSTLDAESRALLLRICGEHAAELARATANIAQLAEPVLTSLGGSRSAVQQRGTDSRAWQPATEDLFQSAQRVERLLATMLDGSPAAATADLPSRLLTALAQLRADAENYRRLLSLEAAGVGK